MGNKWEFKSYRKEVERQLDETSKRGLTAVLEFLKSAIKANAPVQTGHLRDFISYQIKKEGASIVGVVGSPDEYAVYVEYGTGEFAENGAGRKGGWAYQAPDGKWYFTYGMQPTKFMREAFRQNKSQVQQILGEEFGATFKGA
ncbi:HK97-gp10 family putative phage morphogenesis protein [Enterococcus nangangensis]|uniref:HK97-gp10 family putative phage morphogenesis protein n=1 Tax=Enterococcus nangangensis TaxID=2559926 RepID=UPI0010F47BFD|nr:HK97-gp10 family putative phage morphogenesis protein [Enterococcus nangangensis]